MKQVCIEKLSKTGPVKLFYRVYLYAPKTILNEPQEWPLDLHYLRLVHRVSKSHLQIYLIWMDLKLMDFT